MKSERHARAIARASGPMGNQIYIIVGEGDSGCMEKGSPLSARTLQESLQSQTSPTDSSEISILIRGKSGFGQTSSFFPWKLICPGVRRHPQQLLTKGLSTADLSRPIGPHRIVSTIWSTCYFIKKNKIKINSFLIHSVSTLQTTTGHKNKKHGL